MRIRTRTAWRAAWLLVAMAGPAGAAEDPDWPCVQRLVPELSPAMMWAGPPLEEAAQAWRDDPRVRDLAGEVAARRVPLDEAEARIAAFADELDPAARAEALTRLFAGAFELIGRERRSIIAGIKRFDQTQERLGARIRAANQELRKLGGGSRTAASEVRRQALAEQRDWEVRIFEERQQSLSYLCDQPVLLEQRAFALARAIGQELD